MDSNNELAQTDKDYCRWRESVFNRPISKPEWYWVDCDEPELFNPQVTTVFFTRLFEESKLLTRDYNVPQVAQGLNYLMSSCLSNQLHQISQPEVDNISRGRFIRSHRSLFKNLFAIHCTNNLQNLDEAGSNELNGICYMWWDIFPNWHSEYYPDIPDQTSDILDVMRYSLNLESDACRESALHGLGHWQRVSHGRVEQIIDHFLLDASGLRAELVEYAQQARTGYIQ